MSSWHNFSFLPLFLLRNYSPTHFNTKKKSKEKKERINNMGLERAKPHTTYVYQPLPILVLAELFPMALHLLETRMNVNKTTCR